MPNKHTMAIVLQTGTLALVKVSPPSDHSSNLLEGHRRHFRHRSVVNWLVCGPPKPVDLGSNPSTPAIVFLDVDP